MQTGPKKPWKELGRYGSLGIELILSMAVGYYAGRWLDARFDTKGWLAGIGFVVGLYGGFRQIFRAAKRMQVEADREEKEEAARRRGEPIEREGDEREGRTGGTDGDAS